MSTERSVSRRGFLRAAVGAGGVLGASGTGAAAEATETGTPTGADGNETATGDGGQVGQTHTVDMNDNLEFVPADITIEPGDTIEWVNVGSVGHTVTAYRDGIPEEAEYFASGDFDSEDAARSNASAGDIPGGESYSHTFDIVGTYDYFCIPHEGAGMVGSVSVEEGANQGTATPAIIPDSARTLAFATFAALVGTLGFVYVFLKYGGAQPETAE